MSTKWKKRGMRGFLRRLKQSQENLQLTQKYSIVIIEESKAT